MKERGRNIKGERQKVVKERGRSSEGERQVYQNVPYESAIS